MCVCVRERERERERERGAFWCVCECVCVCVCVCVRERETERERARERRFLARERERGFLDSVSFFVDWLTGSHCHFPCLHAVFLTHSPRPPAQTFSFSRAFLIIRRRTTTCYNPKSVVTNTLNCWISIPISDTVTGVDSSRLPDQRSALTLSGSAQRSTPNRLGGRICTTMIWIMSVVTPD